MGGQRAAEFLTGYLLEKSLSVDNLFVFVLLFTAFQVPAAQPAPDPLLGRGGGHGPAGAS